MIVGTAGHVGHGKTTLVKQLTGKATESVEELRRGLTIDLGFTYLDTPTGRVGVVDVPGHEAFISNMVAGVSGFDAALLVISAKDGIQSQTIEHLHILQAMQVTRIAIVISKSDLVSALTLSQIEKEIREFLIEELEPGFYERLQQSEYPIFPTSVHDASSCTQIKEWIAQVEKVTARSREHNEEPFRMPIDRNFHKPGHGCVVTGTMWQGRVKVGQRLTILPDHSEATVRELQVHNIAVSEAVAGQRVAVNLSKRTSAVPSRGMELVTPDTFSTTNQSGCWITPFKNSHPLKHDQEFQLHSSTFRTTVRLLLDKSQVSTSCSAIARMSRPVVISANQNFLLRSSDGRHTVAAGYFLCPHSPSRINGRQLRRLVEKIQLANETSNLQAALEAWLSHYGEVDDNVTYLQQNIGGRIPDLKNAVNSLIACGLAVQIPTSSTLISEERVRVICCKIMALLSSEESQTSQCLSVSAISEKLRTIGSFSAIRFSIDRLVAENRVLEQSRLVTLPRSTQNNSTRDSKALTRVMNCYVNNRSGPTAAELAQQLCLTKKNVNALTATAIARQQLIHIGSGFLYTSEVLQEMWEQLFELFDHEPAVSVSMSRDRWRVTRKHALPLLEYFDTLGYTKRNEMLRQPGPQFQKYIPAVKDSSPSIDDTSQ